MYFEVCVSCITWHYKNAALKFKVQLLKAASLGIFLCFFPVPSISCFFSIPLSFFSIVFYVNMHWMDVHSCHIFCSVSHMTQHSKNTFKGLVHPKIKISPCFTHPQSILGVYDFLLSDKSNRVILKKYSCSYKH